jgi:hypothetical protein
MTYKRFARVAWTFSISPIWLFGTKSELFNTNARLRQLSGEMAFALRMKSFSTLMFLAFPV